MGVTKDNSVRISIPFSANAEKALLGALIQNPENIHYLQSELPLRSDHFFIDRHQLIFTALLDLSNQGVTIDLVTLIQELKNQEKYPTPTRDEFIIEIFEKAPLTENLLYHAEIIRNTFALRNIMESCEGIRQRASQQSFDDISELLDDLDKTLLALRDQQAQGDGLIPGSEVLRSTVIQLEQRMSHDGIPGISSGFSDLDKVTGGFQKSDLTILAARPGMGKTALILNWATKALNEKKTVAFFSLEMSKEQLMERILAAEGKINSAQIRKGQIKAPKDLNKLVKTIKEVNHISTHLLVDETPSISLSELTARCRRYHRDKGLDMVIIDYLQLVVGSRDLRKQGREREVSEISMGLKALAKELGVPVIAAAQLNRSPDSRPDKRPRISDLRESGSMEQDADMIVFIYRDDYYHPHSPDAGQAEIILGKNRHGPLETVRLAYLPAYVSFRQLALIDPLLAQNTSPQVSHGPNSKKNKGTSQHPPFSSPP
ncbi:MAG: replicative DNA helicase [Proteobacteria bacterium]|nr:replicative DNA helicase [Pseudomonadota bacterium]